MTTIGGLLHQWSFELTRYEVLVNGVRRCVAGVDGLGLLQTSVMRCVTPNSQDDSVHVDVSGIHYQPEKHHVRWLMEFLEVGDEVTIRVLAPGVYDEPDHRAPFDDESSSEVEDD